MAQGKPFAGKEREGFIDILRPYLERGNSLLRAYNLAFGCLLEKLTLQEKKKIPEYTTLMKWIQSDNALSIKIKGWQEKISEKARQNWQEEIEKGNYIASKEWLERKNKDEFSTRQETTGAEGNPIEITVEKKTKINKLLESFIKKNE